jgi:Family of unknown function (DUF6580)
MRGARALAVTVLIIGAAAARLLPHPPNLTPIGAIALFGGACLEGLPLALGVPLAALALSDMALGFDPSRPFVYGAFVLMVGLGRLLRRRRRLLPIAATVGLGSLLFYVVTNLGVFAGQALYPRTWSGLAACYVAALPFFWNTLLGDAFYAAVLFGGYALAGRLVPALRGAVSR